MKTARAPARTAEWTPERTLLVCTLVAWLVCTGWCLAGPVSAAVGLVRVELDGGVTAALADPFEEIATLPAVPQNTAAILGAQAGVGDQVHVWTGSAFNTYPWSGTAWTILGTAVPAPAARLSGACCLLTPVTAGSGEAVFIGKVSAASQQAVAVASSGWSLIGCPYPADLHLADLITAGGGEGDQAKLWDPTAQAWRTYEYAGGAWSGPGNPASVVVPAGTAFLYQRADVASLTFRRP